MKRWILVLGLAVLSATQIIWALEIPFSVDTRYEWQSSPIYTDTSGMAVTLNVMNLGGLAQFWDILPGCFQDPCGYFVSSPLCGGHENGTYYTCNNAPMPEGHCMSLIARINPTGELWNIGCGGSRVLQAGQSLTLGINDQRPYYYDNSGSFTGTLVVTDAGWFTPCPQNISGFSYLGEFDGHRYYLGGTADWFASRDACAQAGGYLVCIGSAAENVFLCNSLTGQFGTWTGFSEQGAEGIWSWVNGESVNYTNWGSGEPNNSGGDESFAALVLGGGWNCTWVDHTEVPHYNYVMECEGISRCPNGSISGYVEDESNDRLDGVAFTLHRTDQWAINRTVLTDGNGNYALTDVTAGTYEIWVQKFGYETITHTGWTVACGAQQYLAERMHARIDNFSISSVDAFQTLIYFQPQPLIANKATVVIAPISNPNRQSGYVRGRLTMKDNGVPVPGFEPITSLPFLVKLSYSVQDVRNWTDAIYFTVVPPEREHVTFEVQLLAEDGMPQGNSVASNEYRFQQSNEINLVFVPFPGPDV